jgi:hypothetical protein
VSIPRDGQWIAVVNEYVVAILRHAVAVERRYGGLLRARDAGIDGALAEFLVYALEIVLLPRELFNHRACVFVLS